MSQSLLKLKNKVINLQESIQERGDGLVQQCISSPHFLALQTRFRGKTIFIYIGRGATYQGFDFSEEKLPAQIRIQDKFLQFARKHWRGLRIVEVDCYELDRVLCLKGIVKDKKRNVWFFWRGRDLFFAQLTESNSNYELFQSWQGSSTLPNEVAENLTVLDIFQELGLRELDGSGERDGDINISAYLKKFEINKKVENAVKKSKKEKTLIKMREEVKRFDVIKFLERQTEKDLSNLNKLGEGRFSVSFIGIEGHFKKREHLYNKLKGWRKSRDNLLERIRLLESEISGKKLANEAKPILGKVIQPIWKNVKVAEPIKKETNFIKLNYKSWICYLGRSALENDHIRKEIARKEDWWLHLEHYKSGHMFIKSNDELLSPEDLETLGSALVELNNIDISDIPLIYTKVKNLKGVKGVTGMVNYKKEKHITVHFNQKWRQNLSKIEEEANA